MITQRQNLVKLFSAFVDWPTDNTSRWQTDLRLHRSMERLQQQKPQFSRQQWEAFWHHQWTRKHPLSRDHLYANLQEACHTVANELKNQQFLSSQLSKLSLADFFQYAIQSLNKVLR